MPRQSRRTPDSSRVHQPGVHKPKAYEAPSPEPAIPLADILGVFFSFQHAHPELRMEIDDTHPHLNLSMVIPKQAGMSFDLSLWLAGDVLGIGAGTFCLEWFSCTQQDIVDDYCQTVLALLSGEFRIVEYVRGDGEVVKEELQRPVGERWQTIGASYHTLFGSWFQGRLGRRVLQNQPDGLSAS